MALISLEVKTVLMFEPRSISDTLIIQWSLCHYQKLSESQRTTLTSAHETAHERWRTQTTSKDPAGLGAEAAVHRAQESNSTPLKLFLSNLLQMFQCWQRKPAASCNKNHLIQCDSGLHTGTWQTTALRSALCLVQLAIVRRWRLSHSLCNISSTNMV